jgi:ABC-2 type transport system ATP-binding protein
MRAIVGVQRVAGGSVDVLGLPAGSAALRRRIGYMTQSPSVYGDLTVHENLRYFADVLGARGRVAEVVQAVGLADREAGIVRHLSGGERARVSLAVALLGAPEVLVLDEPTVGLDPLLRRDLWSRFHELAATGITVLVSTHVMDEADRCDDLLLMREGRLLAAGTPGELGAGSGPNGLEDTFIRLAEAQ